MILPVSPPLFVGYVLLCVGEVLHIVGVATTHWIDADDGSHLHTNLNVGLFQICSQDGCDDITDPPSEQKAVRAMMILALLSGLSAIVLATFIFIQRIKLSPVPILAVSVSMVASVVALILTVIGVVVYVEKTYKDLVDKFEAAPLVTISLGYSFALPVVGGVFMAVGGILVFCGGRRSIGGQYSPLAGNR